MKALMKYFTGLSLLFVFTAFSGGNGIFDDVAFAIESGNAKEVSNFFGSEVELKIKDTEAVYSKTEAEIQLKKFFTSHDPNSFKIIHKGSSKKGSQYAIGDLKTSRGNFRTYMLVKQNGGNHYIKELRFEKD